MPKRQGSLRQKKKVDALTAEEQAHINDRRNEESMCCVIHCCATCLVLEDQYND